jgi:hypothetical protein
MRKLLFVVLSICFALSLAALAQPSGNTPVTTTIKDYVDVTDPLTGSAQRIPMQIQSDGSGAYKNSKNVESVIQGIGDWVLDTGVNIKNPTRKVFLDFSQPIPGTGPNGGDPVRPFISALVRPRFISKCTDYGFNMLAMGLQQTLTCPLAIGFYNPADGVFHRVIMNPASIVTNCPETNPVHITCSGADAAGKCNRWEIEPSGACVTADCSVKRNIVRLVKIVTVRGKEVVTDLGDFYMSFTVDVTKP